MRTLVPFETHPLIRGGQLQTYAGTLFSGNVQAGPHRIVQVDLEGGDRLNLHVNEPQGGAAPDAPAVLLLHGLGGCSESPYVLRITRKLNAQGYLAVRYNHRGCGRGGAALARAIYHAGRVEDVHAALQACERELPGRPLLIAGFSLSGNILLRYLGEAGSGAGPKLPRTLVAALAVCPPVDLEACSLALSKAVNLPIDRYYTRLLRATAEERRGLFPDLAHPTLPARLDLRRFDEVYTAPLAGFPSREAYYDRSSAMHSVHAIALPTVVVAADDDPIIPIASLEKARFSHRVRVVPQRGGGHMGFIGKQRTQFGDYRWMDAMVVSWAREAIQEAVDDHDGATR